MEVNKISQRSAAIIAGVSIILMALTAAFSYGWVLSGILIPDNAADTVKAIKESLFLFRFGILGWLLILILDTIAAWALYIFLKQINQSWSLLAALLRLIYTAFLGVAIYNLSMVVVLIDNAENEMFTTHKFNHTIMVLLDGFTSIWGLGLIIFGLHLAVFAYLALKSGFMPKFIFVLLAVAAMGYIVISSAKFLIPQYQSTIEVLETVLSFPMAIGEIALAIWLWVKGGKNKKI